MTGTWLGYYTYHNENIPKVTGFDKTYFTIIISSFAAGQFKGTVTDDIKTGGTAGTGEIIGELKADQVSFKKLMPKRALIYPTGELKYRDEKHPALYYTGILSKDKTEINGTWKFNRRLVFLFGFIPLLYRPGKGNWNMKLQ